MKIKNDFAVPHSTGWNRKTLLGVAVAKQRVEVSQQDALFFSVVSGSALFFAEEMDK